MNQGDIEAMIQRYLEAEQAVLLGKSIVFNGQQMTMENLSAIITGRKEWERRLGILKNVQAMRSPWKLARFP
ncbi:hypothetical protein ACL2XP_17935 [Sodalis sp. RH21]|uniref:hypothetical protein n=1 Tax=unclassified Sodalis (in: enterobacteria) TaxID=2636512 RepID=UPI0039B37098